MFQTSRVPAQRGLAGQDPGVMASLAELTESAWSLGAGVGGGGHRAVDGEENQDSEAGGTPKIPGSSLRSRTPWGILSIFSLASSTCCFISGPAQHLLTWLLLAPGLQLSLSVSSFRAALSPS